MVTAATAAAAVSVALCQAASVQLGTVGVHHHHHHLSCLIRRVLVKQRQQSVHQIEHLPSCVLLLTKHTHTDRHPLRLVPVAVYTVTQTAAAAAAAVISGSSLCPETRTHTNTHQCPPPPLRKTQLALC